MERLAARRLCIFNTNFLFLLRKSKVSCNFILKTSKKFSAFKFSPKLWDKPARTALGPFLRLWSTQMFSALGSFMTSFALVIWAYEQSGSALSTGGVLVLLSTDALCVWCVGAGARLAAHSADERQLRRAVPHPHSREDAGPRLHRAQFAAIFHHSLGYLLGGALVDTVFEPFMAAQTPESLFCCLFGTGKGSGAAFLFLVLGFRRSKLIRGLEANDKD